MTSPIDAVLHQSALHLINYALVLAVLFVSVWQAYVLWMLKRTLRSEETMLRQGTREAADMVHPVAKALVRISDAPQAWNATSLRRAAELYEAKLFVPLRARVALARDLSTLMGLVATCSALVVAGAEFAAHGRPELLVGSVASGTISTCVAAVGCMISLWNLSRLAQLRLQVASEMEEWLLEPFQTREFDPARASVTTVETPAPTLATIAAEEENAHAI